MRDWRWTRAGKSSVAVIWNWSSIVSIWDESRLDVPLLDQFMSVRASEFIRDKSRAFSLVWMSSGWLKTARSCSNNWNFWDCIVVATKRVKSIVKGIGFNLVTLYDSPRLYSYSPVSSLKYFSVTESSVSSNAAPLLISLPIPMREIAKIILGKDWSVVSEFLLSKARADLSVDIKETGTRFNIGCPLSSLPMLI